MEEYFRKIIIPMSSEAFHQMPRSVAYHYEYHEGHAILTPSPRLFRCCLDLTTAYVVGDGDCDITPIDLAHAHELNSLYTISLQHLQPFASLPPHQVSQAMLNVFQRTLDGHDGPLVHSACVQAKSKKFHQPIGALFVTLVPKAMASEPFAGNWLKPPPADAIEKHLGVPHLTWVFVAPTCARQGVATTMLATAIAKLRQLGFDRLVSTFLADNSASALWHWQNGFRLLPQMSFIRKEMNHFLPAQS